MSLPVELPIFRVGFAKALVITERRILEHVTKRGSSTQATYILGDNFRMGQGCMRELGRGDDPVVIELLRSLPASTDCGSPTTGNTPEQVACDQYYELNRKLGAILFGIELVQAGPVLPPDRHELRKLTRHLSAPGDLSIQLLRYFETVAHSSHLASLGLQLFLSQAPAIRGFSGLPNELLHLQTAERAIIEEALRRTKGDKKEAADILGIDRRTLYRMLDRPGT